MIDDRKHFMTRLNDGERRCVRYILSFFAIADSLVNTNVLERFIKEVNYKEAEAFYQMQAAVESIHNTVYSQQLENLIESPAEREALFDAARHAPAIQRMTNYIKECAASDETLQRRMLKMVCAEGILFSGAFCIIYWFGERSLMPGIAQGNEFIARDEGLHTAFSIKLYLMMAPRLPADDVYAIFDEAVQIAANFACDALPEGLTGMNSDLMTQYIKYVADSLLAYLEYPPQYKAANPFGFMEQLNMQVRNNFFECKSSQYARINASSKKDDATGEKTVRRRVNI